MHRLTFRCNDNALRFQPILRRAADVWNDVLSDLVHLREWTPPHPQFSTSVSTALNILVVMDSLSHPIRDKQNPTRVAQCQLLSPDYWQITLSRDVTWATSTWSRFWGRGENALTCLIHELGHVFKLPHASDPAYVMHPEIGGTGKLATREKEHYRTHFLRMLEDES